LQSAIFLLMFQRISTVEGNDGHESKADFRQIFVRFGGIATGSRNGVCSECVCSGNGRKKAVLTADDGKTAQLVATMVSARHINHPPIDDALSAKLLTRFIETWDSQKVYFLKSDIDEFEKQKTSLDDQILAGNIDFANQVFERFQTRMAQREEKIGAQIDAEHDFTADETMIRDPKQVAWAVNEAELDERWRKRIKYEKLASDFTHVTTPISSLWSRRMPMKFWSCICRR
jgi:hypothetical protein